MKEESKIVNDRIINSKSEENNKKKKNESFGKKTRKRKSFNS